MKRQQNINADWREERKKCFHLICIENKNKRRAENISIKQEVKYKANWFLVLHTDESLWWLFSLSLFIHLTWFFGFLNVSELSTVNDSSQTYRKKWKKRHINTFIAYISIADFVLAQFLIRCFFFEEEEEKNRSTIVRSSKLKTIYKRKSHLFRLKRKRERDIEREREGNEKKQQ